MWGHTRPMAGCLRQSNRALKRRWGKPATSAAENCMLPQCLMSGRLSSGKGVGRTVGRQLGKTVQKTIVYKRRKRDALLS